MTTIDGPTPEMGQQLYDTETKVFADIQAALVSMWDAIEKGDVDRYATFVHPDFTSFGENDTYITEGKEAEVRNYRAYLQRATGVHTDMHQPVIIVRGDTAWITYYWTDSGTIEGKRFTSRGKSTTLDEFFARLQEGETKTLNLIVKADVQGSLEPIVNSLEQLNGGEVELQILRSATGQITESDVMLASASDAIILGFNVEADPIARNSAAVEEVQIRTYQIIYKLIEDVEKAMKGLLAPTYEDVVIGRAEVREVFRIRNLGAIAGSYMRTGEGRRNAKARIIRNSRLLHSGNVGSLKHLQDSVREVKSGFEFGVSIDGWNDYQPGDIIEFFVTQRVEV